MSEWLEWARGPVFRASMVIMFIGLLRLVILMIITMIQVILDAKKGERTIPYGDIARQTLPWLFPFRKVAERNMVFGITSFMFHVSIIVTPIFLGAHILLWERGLGVHWYALGTSLADVLTITAIVTGLALFIERLSFPISRGLSRVQDYLLPALIVVPFLSGFLAMHPVFNPVPYEWTMFIHVMSGNMILVLIPFSKISHVVLFPLSQLISSLGWYLKAGSGQQVMITLGKENEAL